MEISRYVNPIPPNKVKKQTDTAERMARAYDKIKDSIPEKNRIDD